MRSTARTGQPGPMDPTRSGPTPSPNTTTWPHHSTSIPTPAPSEQSTSALTKTRDRQQQQCLTTPHPKQSGSFGASPRAQPPSPASVGPSQSSNESAATNWSTRDNVSPPCSAAHSRPSPHHETHRNTLRHLRRAIHQPQNTDHSTGTPPQSIGRLDPNAPHHRGSSHTGHVGLEATHTGPPQKHHRPHPGGQSDAPDTILGRSGQQGIFVEPIHPPIKVAWEKWQPTDTADDYIQRLLDKGHKWGLAGLEPGRH